MLLGGWCRYSLREHKPSLKRMYYEGGGSDGESDGDEENKETRAERAAKRAKQRAEAPPGEGRAGWGELWWCPGVA